jgi:hypothetical protein
MMVTGEPRTIGALSGQLLESICDQLTRKLRIPIPRRDGDRYTLGDLWPAVRTRLDGTAAEPVVQRVASFRALRNLTVHADRASMNLSADDARRFAESVLNLFDALHCASCGSWVRGERTPRCTCGAVAI